jgi:beta-lactamase class A
MENETPLTKTAEIRIRKKRKLRIFRVAAALVILIGLISLIFFSISGAMKRHRIASSSHKPSATSSLVPPAEKSPVATKVPETKVSPLPTPKISPKIVVGEKELKKEIEKELKGFPGIAGIALYDLQTKNKVEIRAKESFEAASLIKIPIMIEAYKNIASGSLRADKEIELKESDKVGGAGDLKTKKAGTRMSVEKLVELMITKSDNTATDLLIKMLGMDNIENTVNHMGMKKTTLKRTIYDFAAINKGKDNITTPEDMETILRELYEGNNIAEQYRGVMLNILKNQDNKKIIPKFLPSNIQIAHKTGSLSGTVHDCGIIYPPDRKPYILVLMSKNVSNNSKAEKQLAEVSKKVYSLITGE